MRQETKKVFRINFHFHSFLAKIVNNFFEKKMDLARHPQSHSIDKHHFSFSLFLINNSVSYIKIVHLFEEISDQKILLLYCGCSLGFNLQNIVGKENNNPF